MSSTRHAPQGSAVSYERYMSSPEYAELRGIPGTAVAAKAQLYADIRKRSLLFFLQALSIKRGRLAFRSASTVEETSILQRRSLNRISRRALHQSEGRVLERKRLGVG